MSFYCMTKPFFAQNLAPGQQLALGTSPTRCIYPFVPTYPPTDNECPLFYNKAVQAHWQQRSDKYSSEHLWDVTNIGQVSSLRGSAPVRSHSCRSQFWSLCGLLPGENLSFSSFAWSLNIPSGDHLQTWWAVWGSRPQLWRTTAPTGPASLPPPSTWSPSRRTLFNRSSMWTVMLSSELDRPPEKQQQQQQQQEQWS